MAGKETSEPTETIRVVDGHVFRVRVIPGRSNQHRIGVSRKPLRWTVGEEINSFSQGGRSKKTT
jgi:hypothetical protein